MYIVQKRTAKQWSEVLRTEDLAEATAKAESYAGGTDCYTEPNGKLKRGFFGFHETDEWKAMISFIN